MSIPIKNKTPKKGWKVETGIETRGEHDCDLKIGGTEGGKD
jgi:hypothetical protein